jgi:hypothetical protein
MPRRRRRWPRPWRIAAGVLVIVVAVIGTSAAVNHEVGKRLATLPLVTTTSSLPTTTTVVAPPQTPPREPTRKGKQPVVAVAPPSTTTSTVVVAQEVPKSAYDIITKLDALQVKDEYMGGGYARYRYGAWRDDDGDGCTTPYDVLIDQGKDVVHRTNPCDIVSGEWHSLYDNVIIDSSDQMTIDHVVGLYEAWKSGAWNWTDVQRNNYLNDLKTLSAIMAVSKSAQHDKNGRDPKDWLPPFEPVRCRYLQTWVDVKTVWKLSVDPGERESIAAAALNC